MNSPSRPSSDPGRRLWAAILAGLAAFSLAFALGGPVRAQDLGQVITPILTVDSDALFSGSAYGKEIAAGLEDARAALEAETREIEAALADEELSLTEKRASLPAEDFRRLADAFDAKVVALRAKREQSQQDFVHRLDSARGDFYEQIGPILAQLMREHGAVALIERRNVLISASGIDITTAAIARIDAALGDGGAGSNPAPEAQTPAPAEGPTPAGE